MLIMVNDTLLNIRGLSRNQEIGSSVQKSK